MQYLTKSLLLEMEYILLPEQIPKSSDFTTFRDGFPFKVSLLCNIMVKYEYGIWIYFYNWIINLFIHFKAIVSYLLLWQPVTIKPLSTYSSSQSNSGPKLLNNKPAHIKYIHSIMYCNKMRIIHYYKSH